MKNNNNKKRVLPLLLAVLLLISAGAYGTRAFFTDDAILKTSIEITTGTIDIEAPKDINWKYEPNINPAVTEAYNINSKLEINGDVISGLKINDDLGSEITISNARPGDAFTLDIEVTNNSTLDMLVSDTFTAQSYNDDLYSFDFTNKLGNANTFTDHNLNGGFTLIEAGETLNYKFKITVDNLASNDFNVLDLTQFAFDNITLNAKQPNAN